MQLIFATNNRNKVAEIKATGGLDIITLEDAGIVADIPEPYDTLEENAFAKSLYIWKEKGIPCFSEDTGLEVNALNGEPGVKSARFAGEPSDPQRNIDLLLEKLKEVPERKAQFRTVISLIIKKVEYQFEGICEGVITQEQKGNSGFGYDPVFIPDGSVHTFAEMNMDEKNGFSHRKKAVMKLISFLKRYHEQSIVEITGKLLFTTTLEVRITDINYGNHTGNDRIAAFLHEARVQWLQSLGYTELDIDGTGVIMSDLSIQYLRESFYGDRLQISVHAGEVGRSSFELYYNICIEGKPESIIAKAKTGMVCYDYGKKKIAAVPDVLSQILK